MFFLPLCPTILAIKLLVAVLLAVIRVMLLIVKGNGTFGNVPRCALLGSRLGRFTATIFVNRFVR